MAKRKFIRDEEWQQQPHVKDGPPPSLWWYRLPDRQSVISAYISRYKRGRTTSEGFKQEVSRALQDLSRLQNKKAWGHPRTHRWWSIPAYARAHGMESATLMKWLRELEKVAIKLFPDSVPTSRKPRLPLTEAEIQEMRQLCLDGMDIKEIAQKFRITSSRVGHLCREQKKQRAAAREKAESEVSGGNNPAPAAPDDLEYPF